MESLSDSRPKPTQTHPYGRAVFREPYGVNTLLARPVRMVHRENLRTRVSAPMTTNFQFGKAKNGIPGDAPSESQPLFQIQCAISSPPLSNAARWLSHFRVRRRSSKHGQVTNCGCPITPEPHHPCDCPSACNFEAHTEVPACSWNTPIKHEVPFPALTHARSF